MASVSHKRRNSVSAGRVRVRRSPGEKCLLLARGPVDQAVGSRLGGVADGLGLGERRPVPLGGFGAGLVQASFGVGHGRRNVAVGRHHLTGGMGVDHSHPVDHHAQA